MNQPAATGITLGETTGDSDVYTTSVNSGCTTGGYIYVRVTYDNEKSSRDTRVSVAADDLASDVASKIIAELAEDDVFCDDYTPTSDGANIIMTKTADSEVESGLTLTLVTDEY